MRLAWTLANRPGASSPTISAAQIFDMGTRSGAAITLGVQGQLGMLAPGALADLLLIDFDALQHPWVAPTVGIIDLLLRKGTRRHVAHVMVGGEWVLRDGQSTRVNEHEVAAALAGQLNRYDAESLRERNAAAVAVEPYLRRFYAAWQSSAPQRQMSF
jgi:cytosine/adenosine deaminase-related metal-dependent hydrolase